MLTQVLSNHEFTRTIFFIECNKFRALPDLHHRLLLIKELHPAASVLFITRKLSFLPMESRHCVDLSASIPFWKNKLRRLIFDKGNIDEIINTCSLGHYLPYVSSSMLNVAILLASGHAVDEIAKRLAISDKAAYAYATKIRHKLNMFSLVQLCFYLENEFHAANPLLHRTVLLTRRKKN
ncbi:hypothetical protein MAQ58_13860 [Enterobacter sp. DRP3]|nr:hypothetical protein [Enterobacter sp. DRP3]